MARWAAAVAPIAALTALAGCSLTADLDSLTAKRAAMDASPADAVSPMDTPGHDGGTPDSPRNPRGELDADVVSMADAVAMDQGAAEDGAQPAVEDAPTESASAPDAPETIDSSGGRPGDDDGGNTPPPPGVDAAPIPDAQVPDGPVSDGRVPDGAADAPPMCARLPSHAATLYVGDSASATTGCGYVRASLSGYIAAVDPTTFAASASCGACLRIETPAGVIVAEVVEQGPSVTPANPTAVAVTRAGVRLLVPDGSTFIDQGVSWRFVQCPLPANTTMTFQFQEGSNANYAALLIERHRFRLASVEYRSNGTYRSLTRASYNYWVAPMGMGGGPFTLRVTDVHGHAVEQPGVPLKPGVVFVGQVQLPECSND